MKRRGKIKRRQKRERRLFLRRKQKRERVQKQKKQIDLARKNVPVRKQKPLDFGHKKEVLVTRLINALACYACYPWLISAAQSNQTEDSEGKDVIVYTTQGEFYLQIKSNTDAAEKFVREFHSKQYKKMYLVAHPDKEKTSQYIMPSPNPNAYAFIIIVVVYREKNVSEEIEDISLVLKKIEVALGIIKQYVEETKKQAEETK
ncbi:MAG: hypothetical protein HZC03_00785 [Candidatus Lloydbacteria bacterium]|nr:hypothetical protein [Candidatus Lloydbacteria bacterium]